MAQEKLKTLDVTLSEALSSSDVKSESGSEVQSISRETGDGMDSSAVSKKLEEELKKRDALIEVWYSPYYSFYSLCMLYLTC